MDVTNWIIWMDVTNSIFWMDVTTSHLDQIQRVKK
jgi:hypothetical protein